MRQKGYSTGKPWTINLGSFISRSQIATLPPRLFSHQKSIKVAQLNRNTILSMLSIHLLGADGHQGKPRSEKVSSCRSENPPAPDNSKYQKRPPQTQIEREKPRWTFPALNQPAIDFLHRSLNGCYSPICNSNEFHYKALEHTQRWRCWPTAMRHGREKRRERGCHSGLCLSVVTTHLPAGWRLKITAEQL